MKYLYVFGDEYSALEFKKKYKVDEVYKEMVSEGVKRKVLDDDHYIEVKILEFGEVDINFEHFIKQELCDYDNLKHSDIYRINN